LTSRAGGEIGQDIFRARLMDYWQGRCPLTGITDPALLRASHIIPWSDCESDTERLNVHNGLLLSALWDAAFDRALVTFDDQGTPQFSLVLSKEARVELRWKAPMSLTDEHRSRLARHRQRARGIAVESSSDALATADDANGSGRDFRGV
jgi:predicted restriction endonuclease